MKMQSSELPPRHKPLAVAKFLSHYLNFKTVWQEGPKTEHPVFCQLRQVQRESNASSAQPLTLLSAHKFWSGARWQVRSSLSRERNDASPNRLEIDEWPIRNANAAEYCICLKSICLRNPELKQWNGQQGKPTGGYKQWSPVELPRRAAKKH